MKKESARTTIRTTRFKNAARTGFELEVVPLELLQKKISQHSPGYEIMDFFICLHFTEGTGTHVVDFKTLKYRAGDTILVSQYQLQKWSLNADAKGWAIMFTDSILNEQRGDGSLLLDLQIASTRECKTLHQASLTNTILSLKDDYTSPVTQLNDTVLKSRLRIFICQLIQAFTGIDETIVDPKIELFYRYRRVLEQNFKKMRTAQEYAEKLYVSTKTLGRAIQHVCGETTKESIDKRVMLEAHRLILSGTKTTKEIAYELEFDEPTNFVKYFKRLSGVSPQQASTKHFKLN